MIRQIYCCFNSLFIFKIDLEDQLKTVSKPSGNMPSPKIGDLVLAKYYLDEKRVDFSWYRAIVTASNDAKFSILFLDYGNQEENVAASEIIPLPAKFSLGSCPPLAYKIRLSGVACMSYDKHIDLLEKFLAEDSFQIEVVSVSRDDTHKNANIGLDMSTYDVLLRDTNGNECLNEQIVSREQAPKAKPKRPAIKRIKLADLPQKLSLKQLQEQKETFLVFSRSIDFFYAFSAKKVNEIQPIVQKVLYIILKNNYLTNF